MPLEIWFSRDVHQVLLAAAEANDEALGSGLIGPDPKRVRAYHQGFRAALSTVALALGLPLLPVASAKAQCAVADGSVPLVSDRPCATVPGVRDEGWARL